MCSIGTPLQFNWGKCPLATASFGHGITTTLLQVVKGYSIIVNGGFKVNPILVKRNKKTKNKMVTADNRYVFCSNVLRFLCDFSSSSTQPLCILAKHSSYIYFARVYNN